MVTADKLAKILGVSRRTIQLMAESRTIPHYKVGVKLLRFDEAEVLRAIHYEAEGRSFVGNEQVTAS